MRRTKITVFFVLTALSALLLVLSFTPLAGGASNNPPDKFTLPDPEQESDADLPPWLAGKIDKETYLRRRGEQLDMLRGRPYNLPYDPRERAIKEMERQESAQKLERQRLALPDLTPTWASLGPAPIPNGQTSDTSVPVSGRTSAIAVHPTNPDTVYVGTAQGGVWKTTNGGNNWTPLFEFQLETEAIGAITIDPTDTNIVYIGTGETALSGDSFAGKGVYIIRNANSATPTLTGPFRLNGVAVDVFSGRSIGRILVDPLNNNIIFVSTTSGTSGNPNAVPGGTLAPRGIYRSVNAQGASPTFEQVSITGLAGQDRNVVDMVMDPGDPNLLIATVMGAAADGGIYRTTDALAATPTFTRTRVLPDGATNGRGELAINRNGSVVTVYAAVGETSTAAIGGAACATTRSGYVTRSVDGGQTWSAPLTGSTGFCGGQCFYDIAIAATQDNQTIHLGGAARGGASPCLIDTMKRSIDGGTSFVRNDTALHPDSHVLAIAPSNQAVVYAGNDGGIWRSGDNGTTWVSKNTIGYSVTQFQSLALHPFDRNFTIGGTQDNGTICLSPDGTTFTTCQGGDGGYALIDRNAQDTATVTMYHTFFNQANSQIGFERALTTSFAWTFRGCSGTTSNNGMTCADTVLFYAPMEQGPGNPNTIYFGTDRLYRSTNRGDSMTLASQAPIVAGQAVTSIGISPQDDNVRIVGLRNGQVFATTTGSAVLTNVTGSNFPPANPNEPTRKAIGRAVIDPNNPNTAYITFSSYGLPSGQQIFKTTNLNSATPTWTPASNGMPGVPVAALVIDPQDSNTMFAGTDIGVYQSTDGSATWTPLGTGLPRVAVFDAEISNVHRVLRIATHGRGLYEITIPGQGLPVIRIGGDGTSGPGGAAAVVSESCAPSNGAIDPNETVSVSFAIKNIGGGPTTNLVATLQATGGVTAPGAPQSYGAIAAGTTVSRNFSFTANGSCGATITLTFQLQDGATNLGTLSVTFTLGGVIVSPAAFAENFDGVTAPSLPPGWTTTNFGLVPLWTTTTAFADTPPNSAATDGSATAGDNSLTTPTIAIPNAPGTGVNPGVQLSFRNNYNTQFGFDGGALEISINGAAFADIISAGGTFVSGGYNAAIGTTNNALSGRQAWTGDSGGFITTVVNLPVAAHGQNAQLRWRTAYNTGTSPAGGGMRIDSVSINAVARSCCGDVVPTPTPTSTPTPTATPAATASPTPTPVQASQAINLSTRMVVQSGDGVGIGGFIVTGTAPKHVLVRALGPSLSRFGIPNPLPDTIIELRGPAGFSTIINDNWRDSQEGLIVAAGLAPTDDLESAIDATLAPGNYTAVLRGKNNSSGVGLIEVYDIGQPLPSKLANISTRAFVNTGSDIVIAGFTLGNSGGDGKIVIRGLGPSLGALGVSPVLSDPTLELRDPSGTLLFSNNDWQDNSAQAAEIAAAGLAPNNPKEAALAVTLPAGVYTALLAGLNNGTGIGIIEVYDRNAAPAP
jgi:cell division septation protein DedD